MENLPEVVSREEWLAARKRRRARGEAAVPNRTGSTPIAAGCRWSASTSRTRSRARTGLWTLLDLFEGRQQLVMHHFMYGPDWDKGLLELLVGRRRDRGRLRQLHVRNTTLVAVSRAPYPEPSLRSASGWAGSSPGTRRTAATSTTTSTPPSTTGSRRCCCTSAPRPSSPRRGRRGRRTVDETCAARSCRASARSCGSMTRSSTPTPRSAAASRSSTTAYPYLDLTALGRQEAWEEPKGRAVPLGLQVGGPGDAPARRVRRGIDAASRVWSSHGCHGPERGTRYSSITSGAAVVLRCAQRHCTLLHW